MRYEKGKASNTCDVSIKREENHNRLLFCGLGRAPQHLDDILKHFRDIKSTVFHDPNLFPVMHFTSPFSPVGNPFLKLLHY